MPSYLAIAQKLFSTLKTRWDRRGEGTSKTLVMADVTTGAGIVLVGLLDQGVISPDVFGKASGWVIFGLGLVFYYLRKKGPKVPTKESKEADAALKALKQSVEEALAETPK